MALSKADRELIKELASLVGELAIRIERQSALTREIQEDELLAKADRAIWDAHTRLEPLI